MDNPESTAAAAPIRNENEGFTQERERYLAALQRREGGQETEFGSVPIPWPIDIRDPNMHVTAYYHDPNYSGVGGQHLAIDIQTLLGTPVRVPVAGKIVSVNGRSAKPSRSHYPSPNHARGLADVMVLEPESGLIYRFAHLDASSLPAEITEDFFDLDSPFYLERGSQIGRVGQFFGAYMREQGVTGLSERVEVPADVEAAYGRSYDHLHFDVARLPTRGRFYPEDFTRYVIDPLPMLERLYVE